MAPQALLRPHCRVEDLPETGPETDWDGM